MQHHSPEPDSNYRRKPYRAPNGVPAKQSKPWYKKVRYILPLALVAAFLIVWLCIDRIAAYATRRGLDEMKGFQGDFSSVHVNPFRLSYNITNLKIIEEPVSAKKPPVFFAESSDVHLIWKELIKFRLAAQLKILKAKSTVDIQPYETPKERVAKEIKEKIPPPFRIDEALLKLIPARIERLEIMDSEAVIVDRREPRDPELWVHDIQATVENFATRKRLTEGKPTTLAVRGVIQRSGKFDMFVTADLLADSLTFAGEARLRKLQLRELFEYMLAKTDMHMPEGTFSVFTSFKCKKMHVVGGVKPVLENVEVRPTNRGLGARIKAKLADKAFELFSDRVPGRNALAALIPIDGDIRNPDIQLWPAILSIVRNAFIEGLSAGMDNLPIEEAGKKEGVLTQAGRALSKDSEAPVKAQPEGK